MSISQTTLIPFLTILNLPADRKMYKNNIWILTDKGVARYQRQSDDFLIPTDETGNNIIAYSVCLTDDGVLFGSKIKIFFYNYQDTSLRLLQTLT